MLLFENPSSSVTAAMKALLPIAAIRSTIFSLIHLSDLLSCVEHVWMRCVFLDRKNMVPAVLTLELGQQFGWGLLQEIIGNRYPTYKRGSKCKVVQFLMLFKTAFFLPGGFVVLGDTQFKLGLVVRFGFAWS